ncbi:MAG: trypsin-like peptidase domain-containing protein [Bacilli bacterium]|jgi:serine protease Do|nr:trypsin-like peptidase domain-containing protein [Bacilli bacterium]
MKQSRIIKFLTISVIVLFIGFVCTLLLLIKLYFNTNSKINSTEQKNSINTVQTSITINDDTTKVVKKVQDSVVTIGLYQGDQVVGNGSGSIIGYKNNYAYILTNNHVVDYDQYKIKVIFFNKKELSAEIVGKDAITDLALLKVKVDFKVTPIEIGDSDALQTGESVIAIGSPFDLTFSGTVTKGIISGLNRIIDTDTNNDNQPDYSMQVIQTDTAINPGNSGGPLINMAGQMVGVNTSKISESGYESMGFAIPSNDAMNIVNQLIKYGKVERQQLGVSYYPVSSIRYSDSTIKLPSGISEGIYIVEVKSGSVAAKAGLKVDDIIYEVNGEKITDTATFTTILYNVKKGDTIKVKVYRNGKTLDINLKF